ncbi:hypothetical protein NEOCIP111885_00045 [Pseudoneobacillus rhizosphaerae]|uniref:Group-specific protein n=1 Tax=Pseudoneobacillus rhizosphaerae TaxID=2880968 RepID=A0A9C7L8Z0_9BACI|nr:hypothetical protein NEOCIP111885_00045 [Pseudoneobacillus rhizosphaerae]
MPKKRFSYKREHIAIPLLAVIIGTYLDLYFVSIGMYSFPKRLFPEIFTINIAFTLIILPVFTYLMMIIIMKMNLVQRWSFLVLTSIVIACIERLSESYGFFIHSDQWKHIYSFFGYLFYMFGMWRCFKWIK